MTDFVVRGTDGYTNATQRTAVRKHVDHYVWYKRLSKFAMLLHIISIIITIVLYVRKDSAEIKQASTLVSGLFQIVTLLLNLYIYRRTNKLMGKINIDG
jgi:hypothetical protein